MIKEVIKFAKEAGELFRNGFYSAKDITLKDTKDLVTQYDVAVENFLKEKLAQEFPDFNIIAEEGENLDCNIFNTFIIDPIDGTTNFVHGVPFCSISIGIYKDGKEYAGIVYNPILDECYYAQKGYGAFVNGESIGVTSQSNFKRSLMATGFPYSNDKCLEDLNWTINSIYTVLPLCQDIRRLGSASLDLCMVAKGAFEGYFEMNLKPWDVSAGIIILKEAGGVVSGVNGREYDLFRDKIIVATNGNIHVELLKLLQGVNNQ